MNFEGKQNIYFLGIGGIGMSALAKYFHTLGMDVAGYDRNSTPITDELQMMGIEIHFVEDIASIPERFTKDTTLVVRTPAVPDSNIEFKYFSQHNFSILKRAEVLGKIVNEKRGIAIAGTHGKTSVSSILTYVMHESDIGCNAFLGGIMKNYSSNLVVDGNSDWVITEADEFDRSFLQLTPEIALITWIDADHLDIYSSREEIKNGFESFVAQVKSGGTVVLKQGIEMNIDESNILRYSYSLNDQSADFFASDICLKDNKYNFTIQTPGEKIKNITLYYPGITNVENAVAAGSVAWLAGVDADTISDTLSSFKGVRRRFDIQFISDRYIYIDDYAHHPRELDAVIESVRKLYPSKKITGIFQPHLYSRTKDFAGEFAASLSALDEIILLDIYPARENPIEGISSEIIFSEIAIVPKTICRKDELMKILKDKDFEVLITMGAGDIDKYVSSIKEMIEKR